MITFKFVCILFQTCKYFLTVKVEDGYRKANPDKVVNKCGSAQWTPRPQMCVVLHKH